MQLRTHLTRLFSQMATFSGTFKEESVSLCEIPGLVTFDPGV